MSFDVVIVGAGIVGAACAESLSKKGLRVGVCDAGAIGAGATAAAMGHVVLMEDSEAQWQLTQYSRALWRARAAQLPDAVAWHPCGTLWLAEDEADVALLEQKQQWLHEREVRCERLEAHKLSRFESCLSETLVAALRVPEDAVIYPPSAAYHFVQNAQAHGADVRTYAEVTHVSRGEVRFANGEIWRATHVLICAGLASIRWLPELPILARKGHLIITPKNATPQINHQLVELGYLKSAHGHADMSVAFNIQPRPTGQILLGSSRQFNDESSTINDDVLNAMITRATRFVPALPMWPALRTWTGLRPCTPDNLPYIGKTARDGIWVAAGHEGLGITTSLGTAAIISAQLCGESPVINADVYSPLRVQTQKHSVAQA